MVKITLDGNELTLTDKQVKEIVKQYKSEEVGLVFKPKYDDVYWYINDEGDIFRNYWDNDEYDNQRLSIGDIYRTKEDAEHELEVRKALTRICMDAPVWDVDWGKGDQDKYGVYYDYYEKLLFTGSFNRCQYSTLPFYRTREQAKQAIEDHEDDYKLVFGVE